jgi:hypothetical protein
MLGRDSYGVLPRTLFALGTQVFPQAVLPIAQSAGREGILVVPFWASVAGNRNDLVVFEELGLPGMFFSCGEFPGYHETTDTADRIDYDALVGETNVIVTAVAALANGFEPPHANRSGPAAASQPARPEQEYAGTPL